MMYTDIVPELQKYDKGLKVPEVYVADYDEGIMIMENLREKDFYMGDKINGRMNIISHLIGH